MRHPLQEQIIDGTAAGSALPFILSKGLNQFNHDLFPALAQVNDANIVISPFSLHTALTMTMYGAPADSNTYKQLSKVLYGSQESDSNTLRTRQKLAFLTWFGIFFSVVSRQITSDHS